MLVQDKGEFYSQKGFISDNPIRSRISVSYLFLIAGFLSGNWIVRIPDIQTKFSLSEGQLGILLASASFGAILVMLIFGHLVNLIGSKTITVIGTVAVHCMITLLFLAPNVLVLGLIIFIYGSSTTTMSIAINTQGIEVERKAKKSIISSFHSLFSTGALLGAIIGALILGLKVNPEVHLITISFILLPFSLFSFKYLQNNKNSPSPKKITKIIQLPPRDLWILGLILYFDQVGERMMGDWSIIYSRTYSLNVIQITAFSYAIFSLFMVFGRLSGDTLANKFKTYKIIRFFSLVAFAGIIVSVSTNDIIFIFLGFALFGVGLSIIVPFIYKSAGNRSNLEIGTGLAGVAIFNVLANFTEPVFIGLVAEFFSLKIAFLIVGIFIASIFILGKSKRFTEQK